MMSTTTKITDCNRIIEMCANNSNKHHLKVSGREKPAHVITRVDRNEEESLSSSADGPAGPGLTGAPPPQRNIQPMRR